jgi:hypothetical protein
MGERQWFVLYVLVCLEVGIFLALVPWSAIWERNYFLEVYPTLRPIVLAPAFRGAVAGLGLGNIYLGLHEIIGRFRGSPSEGSPSEVRRRREEETSRREPEHALTASEERS